MNHIPGAGRREGELSLGTAEGWDQAGGTALLPVPAPPGTCQSHPWGTAGAEGHGQGPPSLSLHGKPRGRGETTGGEGKGCSQSSSKGCGSLAAGSSPQVMPPLWGGEENPPGDGKRKVGMIRNSSLAPAWLHLSIQTGWGKFYMFLVGGKILLGRKREIWGGKRRGGNAGGEAAAGSGGTGAAPARTPLQAGLAAGFSSRTKLGFLSAWAVLALGTFVAEPPAWPSSTNPSPCVSHCQLCFPSFGFFFWESQLSVSHPAVGCPKST